MQKIWQEAEALQTELVERRRDLHRHPETGWTEFRTASIVIKELQALQYEIYSYMPIVPYSTISV